MSKLIVQKVQTHTDGSLKDHQYGIGDVGLVLEILRNKLYKDPILAVVREYVTNARDAHVGVPSVWHRRPTPSGGHSGDSLGGALICLG